MDEEHASARCGERRLRCADADGDVDRRRKRDGALDRALASVEA
jgi:hypothetical protein